MLELFVANAGTAAWPLPLVWPLACPFEWPLAYALVGIANAGFEVTMGVGAGAEAGAPPERIDAMLRIDVSAIWRNAVCAPIIWRW